MTHTDMGDRSPMREQLRRLLALCSACRADASFPAVHVAMLKNSVLTDNAAAKALQDALGPEPWDLQRATTAEVVRRHIYAAGEQLLAELYADHPIEEAHVLSTTDIDRYQGDISSLTYGEIDFSAFSEVLQVVRQWCGSCKTFYDLGSGTGRAVFAAAMNIDFDRLVGIEVLQGLYTTSLDLGQRFNQTVAKALNATANPSITFAHGDFLDAAHSWVDGDVVFANSTCFEAPLMDGIAAVAEQLRPGAILITFSTAIRSLWFRVVFKRRYNMSWGPATVFVQIKLDEDGYQTRLREGTEYDNDQDVVYPSTSLLEHVGSDADSLKVYFSETSSLPDGTERFDVWSQPTGSEVAAEEGVDEDSSHGEAEIEESHDDPNAETHDEGPPFEIQAPDSPATSVQQQSELEEGRSNGSWVRTVSDQTDDSCLSPSEEALYDQVRQRH